MSFQWICAFYALDPKRGPSPSPSQPLTMLQVQVDTLKKALSTAERLESEILRRCFDDVEGLANGKS